MDEIKLFKELQPPSPHDVARMRHAARARLTVAFSAPVAYPARRRTTVVAMAGAAALVAAGTGYSLSAAQGGTGAPRGTADARGGANASASSRSHPQQATAAGLTAVRGCPGMYITAGTLDQVNGARLIIQPANDQDHVNRTWQAKPVTVATTASSAITRPASGTVGDITDGSHVFVDGSWSGETLVASQVGIEATLPSPSSFGPSIPPNAPKLGSKPAPGAMPPFADGTVVDAHDGSFTVVTRVPAGLRVRVTTSSSTKVVARTSVSPSQLDLGSNVVAVGPIGANGVMTASTVAESSLINTLLAGGPAKIRSSGCSASAITTAAIEADVVG
ncbi:MAG TPA: hypothetical protein VNV62_02395 [Trebonia sp.]|nr:hypothetical protein [Trebonia sp.]